jgi:hypothetical protein
MTTKFKPGDRVIHLQTLRTGTICKHLDSKYSDDLYSVKLDYPDEGESRIRMFYIKNTELEEVYNSPLYKLMKEDE